MTIMKKILSIIAVVALTILSASCSTPRVAASDSVTAQTSQNIDKSRSATWQNVQIPVRVSLEKPMSFTMSGRATMFRDSLINISMRVLGMEVAVINLNTDSLYIVDKFHKYYFAEPLVSVLGSHKMSVADIQDIIMGTNIGEGSEITFNNPGSTEPVHVQYSDFTSTPAGNMSQDIVITAPVTGKDVEASLQWTASKAKWDSDASVRFKTPDASSYTRITIANVLKMLQAN